MWSNTRITQRLGIRYPLFQAPMAGVTNPTIVAEVSNAGGLGNLGAAMLSPLEIRTSIREIKAKTDKPFGVNLFIPQPYQVDAQKISKLSGKLEGIMRGLGMDDEAAILHIKDEKDYRIPFDEQVEVILQEQVPVFSWTFGIPSHQYIERFKESGTMIVGTATNVEEALACMDAGVDAVVAQGSEAGGHRGTFLKPHEHSLIGTMALVPSIVDAIGQKIPVIAAGGIMDGRGILAALTLGAEGIQMGTAFLTCVECGTSSSYRQCLLSPGGRRRPTVVTKAFSGKPARGVYNGFIAKVEEDEDIIPDFPVLNDLTRPIRQAASQKGDWENQSIWAGQAFALRRPEKAAMKAGDLIKDLIQDVLQRSTKT